MVLMRYSCMEEYHIQLPAPWLRYVLSLLGFIFLKASVPEPKGARRGQHSCVVARKRKMIIVGGFDEFLRFPKWWRDPDPWSKGLGVFDLAEMRWSDRYNAAAEGKQLFLGPQSTTPPIGLGPNPSTSGSPSSSSLGLTLGGVLGGVGGVIVLAVAAFLIPRRRRKGRGNTVGLELSTSGYADKILHAKTAGCPPQELPPY
ncbi:hypothetical protein QBC36DRAFT_139034 [Triangularia setosa]|uniref:Uncharacterized protein n=1 Tax=Triangularia setosa TaxID=2587417 RepID=A0AAN6VVP1_9PEZI|nr:hypothetical protein QBC36DRAFT_139034 [Podospora setosa]